MFSAGHIHCLNSIGVHTPQTGALGDVLKIRTLGFDEHGFLD